MILLTKYFLFFKQKSICFFCLTFVGFVFYNCNTQKEHHHEIDNVADIDNIATYDLQNKLILYYGNDNQADQRYDIGVLFEGVSDQEAMILINECFGDGPYSLFQTIPFNTNRDKFNIYYGTIPKIADTNQTIVIPQSTLDQVLSNVSQNIMTIETGADLSAYIVPIQNYISTIDINTLPQILKKGLQEFEDPSYFYANYLSTYNKELPLGELGQKISNNLTNFSEVFKNYSFLDSRFHCSAGIAQGYASYEKKDVYVPLFSSDSYIHQVVFNLHEHYFAITAVHEFGHVFTDLVDEYYPYNSNLNENDSSHYKIKKNCYGSKTNNPWTNIPNYNTDDVYQGSCGGATLRGTYNSIMRAYHGYRNTAEWKNGWGVINSYYLQETLNELGN